MKANQAELPVRALCETLKVSTSGYYDWRDRPLSKRAQANAVLREHIRRAHLASDETYGMPRIRAKGKRRFKVTTGVDPFSRTSYGSNRRSPR